MSEYLPPVVAQLTGDIGDFLDKIAEAEAAIASLEGKSVDINFNTSTTAEADALNQVVQDAERVKETLLSIEDLRPWEAINSSAAITQLRLIDAQLAQTRADAVIDLVLNTDQAEAAITQVEEKILTIEDLQPWMSIEDSVAKAQLASIDAMLAQTKADAVIDLVLNTDQAEAAITQVEEKLLTMEDLQPWGSVNDSVFQAQMASIDATLAQTKADAIATAAALALAETGGLGGGGGTEGGGGGGGGEGGGGGGLIAGLGGNTANIMAAVHAIHIFLPEILGLGAALAVSAAGFISLGVASYGTVKGIYAGYSAVSAASDALSAAIPGTTQWTAAVGQMGTAWSSIPTALQPAVGAINNLISKMGSSPLGQEVRSWVVGQVGTLTHMFAGAGSAFTPLIEATQRAVDTTEGVLAKLMGSSGFRGMLSRMSAMVGPAVMQLGELGLALGKIAYGFIKAIQGGAGMNTLVQIFRTLANIVNSSFFQGFVAGWVAFDRIVATVIGWAFRLLGVLSSLGLNIKGLGEVLGFVVSGFAMWIAVTSVIGWIRNLGGASQTAAVDVEAVGTASADAVAGIEDAGTAAETTGTEMEAGGAGAMGFAKSLMGPAALIFGVTGLAQSLGKLTGIANPIGSLFHSIGGAIQFVSHGFTNTDSTTRAYTKSLHGAIYGTEQLSKAQDMLVRSEQSIGGSLGAMANGLQQWSLTSVTATVTAAGGWGKYVAAATSSVNSMVTLLQNKNGSLATWAADAQILIKRGMDPSAVASMAQQAPQDLASMVKGSTAQLHDFNVQTQAQLLLATMSGSQGIKGMTAQMAKDFKNGTPAIKAAAAQVATQLGAALGHPFTGTMSSINQISNALNTMPASVVQALAGKLHQIAPAATAAAKATTTLKGATQNTSSTIMSMVMDVGMIGLGLKGTMPLLSSAGTTVANFAKSLLGMGPAGDVAAEGEVAAGTGAEDASAGFLALDASAGIILLAIAAVGIAAYEIYKHWSGVSHFFVGVWDEIKRIFDAAMTFIKAHLSIFAEVLGTILLGPLGGLVAFIATHWNTVKRITLAAWNAVKGYILPPGSRSRQHGHGDLRKIGGLYRGDLATHHYPNVCCVERLQELHHPSFAGCAGCGSGHDAHHWRGNKCAGDHHRRSREGCMAGHQGGHPNDLATHSGRYQGRMGCHIRHHPRCTAIHYNLYQDPVWYHQRNCQRRMGRHRRDCQVRLGDHWYSRQSRCGCSRRCDPRFCCPPHCELGRSLERNQEPRQHCVGRHYCHRRRCDQPCGRGRLGIWKHHCWHMGRLMGRRSLDRKRHLEPRDGSDWRGHFSDHRSVQGCGFVAL